MQILCNLLQSLGRVGFVSRLFHRSFDQDVQSLGDVIDRALYLCYRLKITMSSRGAERYHAFSKTYLLEMGGSLRHDPLLSFALRYPQLRDPALQIAMN
jgi:hypothetical protein